MFTRNSVVGVEMMITGQILKVFSRETWQDSVMDSLWGLSEKEKDYFKVLV